MKQQPLNIYNKDEHVRLGEDVHKKNSQLCFTALSIELRVRWLYLIVEE